MHYQCNCTYMKSQRQQRINCYIQFYWLPSFQSIPLVSVDSMVSFGRSLTVSPNGDPDGVGQNGSFVELLPSLWSV